MKLAIYLVGKNSENHFNKEAKFSNINDLKDITHKVLQKSKIDEYNQTEFKDSFFKYGIVINKNQDEIARIGEISEEIKSLFEIKEKVFYSEIKWNEIYNLSKQNLFYKPVSKYPEVKRDLSLIINKSTTFNEIEKVIMKHNFNIIKEMNLYDIYHGKNIEKNKKAYAIRFILQDNKGTLNDKKINIVMKNLMKSFRNDLKAEIRE